MTRRLISLLFINFFNAINASVGLAWLENLPTEKLASLNYITSFSKDELKALKTIAEKRIIAQKKDTTILEKWFKTIDSSEIMLDKFLNYINIIKTHANFKIIIATATVLLTIHSILKNIQSINNTLEQQPLITETVITFLDGKRALLQKNYGYLVQAGFQQLASVVKNAINLSSKITQSIDTIKASAMEGQLRDANQQLKTNISTLARLALAYSAKPMPIGAGMNLRALNAMRQAMRPRN